MTILPGTAQDGPLKWSALRLATAAAVVLTGVGASPVVEVEPPKPRESSVDQYVQSRLDRLRSIGDPTPRPKTAQEFYRWFTQADVTEILAVHADAHETSVGGTWYGAVKQAVEAGLLVDELTGEPLIKPSDENLLEVAHESDIAELTQRLYDYEVARHRAKEMVRERIAAETAQPIPPGVTVAELLQEDDEPLRFRISELWPAEGRVVMAAARKAGKTTTVGNVARCLVDGGELFGRFSVTPVSEDGRVVLLDFEMSRNMLRSWYRDLGIKRLDAVCVYALRGLAGAFDVRSAKVRTRWADELRAVKCEVLLVDCLAPMLNALALDESRNPDVGPLLDGLDALITEAGVTELLVAHHMGHGAERSRGASRLRDWPEVEWKLVRQRDQQDNEVDGGARFFSAYGRDVDVEESQLIFDPAARALRLGEAGQTRQRARSTAGVEAVVSVVAAQSGCTKNVLKMHLRSQQGISHNEADMNAYVAAAVASGRIHVVPGPNRSERHHFGPDPAIAAGLSWAAKGGGATGGTSGTGGPGGTSGV